MDIGFGTAAFICYFLAINLYAAAITCIDKRRSKMSGKRRIPEKTLFAAAALGGAAGMYITMRAIRHKTRHKRFMVGIPLIMAAHILIMGTAAYLYLKSKGIIPL